MNHSTNDDTNDQTPSDPEPTETSLSLDAITERRLRNHLATSAERVTLCDLDSSSVRRTARQRTVRRHRMVVGGVAAATVIGMVVGVQALSGGGGEGIRFTEGDATATDPNPLRVAVAGLDSTEWTVSELPIDTNATSDLPFIMNYVESSVTSVGTGALVSVTPTANVNVEELAKASDAFDFSQYWESGPKGIKVENDECEGGADNFAPRRRLLWWPTATGCRRCRAPGTNWRPLAAPNSPRTVSPSARNRWNANRFSSMPRPEP